ncbi:MAG: ABC transporter ATP-binding protein [Tissierellia bacterium]|nr:ABC transporter ATP-binding protein [Tissierellia bacterium]
MAQMIELKNVRKSFGENEVLKGIDLSIRDGEFVTLLGPSGCGKTTTLRIIAGFEEQDSGEVLFKGKKLNEKKSYERNINTVFQNYALFPHLNVRDNIAFGLKIKKVPEKERYRKVSEILELVNLPGIEKRSISSLSGGQQQRIAIARALVNEPEVLLLDEPLGALDLKLRQQMQFELKRIQEAVGITFIYVTHDQEEALTMSDTIVVMNAGEIQQIGGPIDIYNEPINPFVAKFIGESNVLDGVMKEDFLVHFAGRDFNCVDKGFLPNEPVHVVLRPEDIVLSKEREGALTGVVESLVFKGVHYEMLVKVQGISWIVQSTMAQEVGETVSIDILPDNIHVMHRKEAED